VRLRACVTAALVVVAGCGDDSDILPSGPPPATTPTTATSPTTETAPPVAEPEPGTQVPPIPERDTTAKPPEPELFFLFPAEDDARAAAGELATQGYRVRTTPPADDVPEWSVIAEGTPTGGDLATAETAFRAWAQALGGRYDGNEIPVGP
jgi:hypothetical protein